MVTKQSPVSKDEEEDEGRGEMAQWLKKPVALAEDPDLVPVSHMKGQNHL